METRTFLSTMPHAMIVEDESDLSAVYKMALMKAGYFVQTFNNGIDAAEHLKKVSPRLLLLDLNLPGASGEEILKSIKNVPAHQDTKVFLLTSNVQMGDHLATEVDILLEKPVRFKLLCRLAEKYKPERRKYRVEKLVTVQLTSKPSLQIQN